MNQITGSTNYLQRRINMSVLSFVIGVVSFILSYCPAHAQTEADLHATIERHYAAINAKDRPTIVSHHLPEFSIFSRDGGILVNQSVREARERVGAKRGLPTSSNVYINHFTAQIYGNVGVAMFYLHGSITRGETLKSGIWRVTAVWVYEDSGWKEAHHHESPMVTGDHP